ncbi:MAG: hypothetical protein JNM56_20550 [Planctomycetia bacterium]|nr:hypothetical protein [Planctomycetia bacterium]
MNAPESHDGEFAAYLHHHHQLATEVAKSLGEKVQRFEKKLADLHHRLAAVEEVNEAHVKLGFFSVKLREGLTDLFKSKYRPLHERTRAVLEDCIHDLRERLKAILTYDWEAKGRHDLDDNHAKVAFLKEYAHHFDTLVKDIEDFRKDITHRFKSALLLEKAAFEQLQNYLEKKADYKQAAKELKAKEKAAVKEKDYEQAADYERAVQVFKKKYEEAEKSLEENLKGL